jgi:hypothetical protein
MEFDPDDTCEHIVNWKNTIKPTRHECEECIKSGSRWVHLRTCQTCGATLCCDSSINKHASAHARQSGHPVIISAEKGERWAWCYVDEKFTEY